jgi:hypothetical protein
MTFLQHLTMANFLNRSSLSVLSGELALASSLTLISWHGIGELIVAQHAEQLMSQRNVASGQCYTRRCQDEFAPTTDSSGTDDSQSTVSRTRSSRIPSQNVETIMLRSSPLPTGGVGRTRWRRSRRLTRACHFSSSARVCLIQ